MQRYFIENISNSDFNKEERSCCKQVNNINNFKSCPDIAKSFTFGFKELDEQIIVTKSSLLKREKSVVYS